MKPFFIAIAIAAAIVGGQSIDADFIVPENEEFGAPEGVLEAYKTQVMESIKALNLREKLAYNAANRASAEREQAQYKTADLMAHNDALMADMDGEFPTLMQVQAPKEDPCKKECPKKCHACSGECKKDMKGKACTECVKKTKCEKCHECHAKKHAAEKKHEEHKKAATKVEDEAKHAAEEELHKDTDEKDDYGKCVTPPELSAFGHGKGLFGPIKNEHESNVEQEEAQISVGAIRTMCSNEIKEKGSSERATKKELRKMKDKEAKAKNDSKLADEKTKEAKEKARGAENSEKKAVKGADQQRKDSKESTAKLSHQINKIGHEAKSKSRVLEHDTNKEVREERHENHKVEVHVAGAGSASVEKNIKADKATEKADDKEVEAKEHLKTITKYDIAHRRARHATHRVEKRVTIIKNGRDRALEAKGKHEWMHQELVDKNGVKGMHKENAEKMKALTEAVEHQKGKTTVINHKDTGAEKASKTQLRAFKEFTRKEERRVSAETKTKRKTNEMLLKNGEKINKKEKELEKSHAPRRKIEINEPHSRHPDAQLANKLEAENKELSHKLEGVNRRMHRQPNDEGVIKVLKAEVKELTSKHIPRRTKIIRDFHGNGRKEVEHLKDEVKEDRKGEHEEKEAAKNAKDEAKDESAKAHEEEAKANEAEAEHGEHKAVEKEPRTKTIYYKPKHCTEKESMAKHPYAMLEKSVRRIEKLKGKNERTVKSLRAKLKNAHEKASTNEERAVKHVQGIAEGHVHKLQEQAKAQIHRLRVQARTEITKCHKNLMHAQLALKEGESEICDKSRTASEMSNKHETHFWVGMVKEVRAKAETKPKDTAPNAWKNKLCAAVHDDVERMAGVRAVALLQQ